MAPTLSSDAIMKLIDDALRDQGLRFTRKTDDAGVDTITVTLHLVDGDLLTQITPAQQGANGYRVSITINLTAQQWASAPEGEVATFAVLATSSGRLAHGTLKYDPETHRVNYEAQNLDVTDATTAEQVLDHLRSLQNEASNFLTPMQRIIHGKLRSAEAMAYFTALRAAPRTEELAAERARDAVKAALDEHGYRYEQDGLVLSLGLSNSDTGLSINMGPSSSGTLEGMFNITCKLAAVYSFEVPEQRIAEAALLCVLATYGVAGGSFIYVPATQRVSFVIDCLMAGAQSDQACKDVASKTLDYASSVAFHYASCFKAVLEEGKSALEAINMVEEVELPDPVSAAANHVTATTADTSADPCISAAVMDARVNLPFFEVLTSDVSEVNLERQSVAVKNALVGALDAADLRYELSEDDRTVRLSMDYGEDVSAYVEITWSNTARGTFGPRVRIRAIDVRGVPMDRRRKLEEYIVRCNYGLNLGHMDVDPEEGRNTFMVVCRFRPDDREEYMKEAITLALRTVIVTHARYVKGVTGILNAATEADVDVRRLVMEAEETESAFDLDAAIAQEA